MVDFGVGFRYLVKNGQSDDIMEIEILEVSPSGEHLKVKLPWDFIGWKYTEDYNIIEKLDTDLSKLMEERMGE